jgi:hypothetical protein
MLTNEFLFKPGSDGNASSLYIVNLLKLTGDNDPQGALSCAQYCEQVLTRQLKEADQWPNLEDRLKGMGMEEGNRIRRLLERRKAVKDFIEALEVKHPPLLPGSRLKREDLITSADAIFLGEFTDLGNAGLKAAGMTVYRGSQVTVIQKWKGAGDPVASYQMEVVWGGRGESAPDLKRHYIFFVKRDGKNSGHIDKLEHATSANVDAIKASISKAAK